jgi:hypothetical protein
MVSSKILRSEPSFDRALDAVKFLPILLVALLFCGPALRAQEVPTTTGPLTAQSSESWLVWVIGNWHLSLLRHAMARKDEARRIHERGGS